MEQSAYKQPIAYDLEKWSSETLYNENLYIYLYLMTHNALTKYITLTYCKLFWSLNAGLRIAQSAVINIKPLDWVWSNMLEDILFYNCISRQQR